MGQYTLIIQANINIPELANFSLVVPLPDVNRHSEINMTSKCLSCCLAAPQTATAVVFIFYRIVSFGCFLNGVSFSGPSCAVASSRGQCFIQYSLGTNGSQWIFFCLFSSFSFPIEILFWKYFGLFRHLKKKCQWFNQNKTDPITFQFVSTVIQYYVNMNELDTHAPSMCVRGESCTATQPNTDSKQIHRITDGGLCSVEVLMIQSCAHETKFRKKVLLLDLEEDIDIVSLLNS